MTTTTKKKKTTSSQNTQIELRIRKVKNGYTVTIYDKDYNDTVSIFHTEAEVRKHIDGLKF